MYSSKIKYSGRRNILKKQNHFNIWIEKFENKNTTTICRLKYIGSRVIENNIVEFKHNRKTIEYGKLMEYIAI